jgi:hypothetical protein
MLTNVQSILDAVNKGLMNQNSIQKEIKSRLGMLAINQCTITLREECRLRVLENRVLRRIFEP